MLSRLLLLSKITLLFCLLSAQKSTAQTSSIDLKTLKSLMFKSSIDETEKTLKAFGYSFKKSAQVARDNSLFDCYAFEQYNTDHYMSESVMVYLDTNILRRMTPTIRYIADGESVFDQLKTQCQGLGATLTSEGTENGVYYRIFNKDGWTYAFSIGKQDETTVYDLTINWHL